MCKHCEPGMKNAAARKRRHTRGWANRENYVGSRARLNQGKQEGA